MKLGQEWLPDIGPTSAPAAGSASTSVRLPASGFRSAARCCTPRYGWCLVEPREGYRPQLAELSSPSAKGVMLPTGNFALVNLTFVDADDRVAFFSEGPNRVFARSKAIVGRKVQDCHPPRSVDVVGRILSGFREGRHNVAEFWIQFTGRFVHIRYFVVRDGAGRYLGTMEVTQDVGHIRALEGERRLLEYDIPVGAAQ